MAIGVDRMVPNHDLPLCFRPRQLALQLKQVTLPGLFQYAPWMEVACSPAQPACQHSNGTTIVSLAMVINAI